MKLFTGYKSSDLDAKIVSSDAVFHALDIYHQHAIEKVFPSAKVITAAHLPRTAPDGANWELVKFRTGPKLMSGELSLDILQECHQVCSKVELDYLGRERDRNDLLDKVKDRIDRKFRAEWPASVPSGPKLQFTSFPGCFCHRRLDEGGLALAEVVSRELSTNYQLPTINLLDMGCGCGLVGFLIKSVVPEVELTMVDSHSRAIEAVEENSKKFEMPVTAVLSDNGTPKETDGTFDVFVGNPPYYSDYRIADVFLETAKRALKKGGVCYTVCKNAEGLKPVQERYFKSVNVINRRGYAVLKSVAG